MDRKPIRPLTLFCEGERISRFLCYPLGASRAGVTQAQNGEHASDCKGLKGFHCFYFFVRSVSLALWRNFQN
jgi:hypothetical protein